MSILNPYITCLNGMQAMQYIHIKYNISYRCMKNSTGIDALQTVQTSLLRCINYFIKYIVIALIMFDAFLMDEA